MKVSVTIEVSFKEREFWWVLDLIPDLTQRVQFVKEHYNTGHINDQQLWDLLSNHHSPFPTNIAAHIYRSLGFVPFAGFPLVKQP